VLFLDGCYRRQQQSNKWWGRQVDIRDGNGGSRAFPAKVVYFLPYNPTGTNGNGGSTTVQDFQTPITFTDDLYVDVHTRITTYG